MNKTIKKSIIVVFIIIMIPVLLFCMMQLVIKYELSKLIPSETVIVDESVYVIKNAGIVNLFLIKTENGFVAIDAGDSIIDLQNELSKFMIDPLLVKRVYLTHTDRDHTGGLSLFKNAEVFISENEVQMINGTINRAPFMKTKFPYNYSVIDNFDEISFDGIRIKPIETPGHTPGSLCYLVNDQYLFTGDSMSIKNGKADIFNVFFNMNSADQIESIRKLAGLKGVKMIFTGHYGISDDFDVIFGDYK